MEDNKLEGRMLRRRSKHNNELSFTTVAELRLVYQRHLLGVHEIKFAVEQAVRFFS